MNGPGGAQAVIVVAGLLVAVLLVALGTVNRPDTPFGVLGVLGILGALFFIWVAVTQFKDIRAGRA